MKIFFAAAIAVIANLSVPTIARAQEYSGCPDPNLVFQEYKIQLAVCMSDAGRKLSDMRLDRLAQDPVEFSFVDIATPLPNQLSTGVTSFSIKLGGLKYRSLDLLVSAQPDRIYGIHQSLAKKLEKTNLRALPAPYEVLEAEMFGSFAQTLSLVGQSASGAKTESEAANVQKADSAEVKATVSGEKTKSAEKADEKVEPSSSEQVKAPSSAGAAASGGNTIYAIAGGLGAAAALGGGGSSSCLDPSSISFAIASPATFDEAAGADLLLSSSQALCSPITVTLSFSGEAIAGTDFLNNTTSEIAAGQTSGSISLIAIDDNLYEGSEAISVAMTFVADGNIIGLQQTSLVLLDNEAQPTISLSTSANSIDEKIGSATLTAAASVAADENMVVTLSGSGTATAGTDYTLPTIVIAAGSLTGTATFTPTDDTAYETTQTGGAEVATLDIVSVTIGAENGTQSVSITITEDALNSGAQLTYNSTTAETVRTSSEFTYFSNNLQNVEELERINLHRAHGYGLSGNGETVMVIDSCYNTNHDEFSSKTITTLGSVTSCDVYDVHGAAVAGVATAEADGSGMLGVAPSADLIHVDYANNNIGVGNTGFASNRFDKFKSAYEIASTSLSNKPIASNNSWMYVDGTTGCPGSQACQIGLDDIQTSMSYNSYTAAKAIAQFLGTGFSDAEGDSVTNMIQAMDNFQSIGAIVWSLSNYTRDSEANFMAGLPELFPELEDAWITAVNIDIAGSQGNETYIRQSSQCGSTAKYCLGADAHEVTFPGHTFGNYYAGSGTSFVSPMISGALALLAEAFPNHTPEMLVDRLLASADNVWPNNQFVVAGSVTFSNGVQHSYSAEHGHGIMDIYAALQPITTSSTPLSIYAGASNLGENLGGRGGAFGLSVSALSTSPTFGDAVINGLAGINNYAYDAMNGGFAYDLVGHISQSENVAKSIHLSSELQSLKASNLLIEDNEKDQLYSYGVGSNKGAVKYSLTRGNASLPVQNFLHNENTLLKNHVDYETPYLSRFEDGIGLNAYFETDQRTYFFGYNPKIADDLSDGSMLSGFDRLSVDRVHEPFPDSNIFSNRIATGLAHFDDPNLNAVRRNGSFAFGFKQDLGDSSNIRFIAGLAEEDNGFLGLSGSGAFTLDGAETSTAFTGVNFASNISPNLSFGAVAIYANSEMFNRGNTMLSGVDRAVSNSFGLNFQGSNIWGSDQLEISFAQPNRIKEGSMRVRVTKLADAEGNLSYRSQLVSLEPSGRQIDLSVGYARALSKDFVFSTKLSRTSQLNHVKIANDITIGYLGTRYKNLLIGVSTSAVEDEFLVHWSHRF